MTNARLALHAVLLSVAVIGLLPLIIIFGGFLLALLLAVLTAAAGDGSDFVGGELAEGGMKLLVPYYRFLARQRHPGVLGVALGLPLGALLLWALLAVLVLPGETRTAATLASAKRGLESHYHRHKAFPAPGPGDTLSAAILDDQLSGTAEDGFGRPLRYQISGAGRLGGYQVTSLGFDGVESADDLCVSGGSLLHNLLVLGKNLTGKESLNARLSGLRDLRCPAR